MSDNNGIMQGMKEAAIFAMFKDISIERIIELAEAEREGRVVVLPFKIGDKAYWMTHFGKMKASGTVVDILIREGDVLVGIDAENGSGTRKSTKDILYFQGAEAARADDTTGKVKED